MHGTTKGYAQHQSVDELPCIRCWRANEEAKYARWETREDTYYYLDKTIEILKEKGRW